ncbi:hypothetical protein [Flavobacterium tructae]|uniref:Uncharacterized protein n=1 Tax=Flavobacterium tructae TaxID=1114873 RepID=A0A1S1J048_9FLAO|nr:hypothetical protein [Flavobacterium tructae]OHT43952.1 hypothetical protein BHE19_16585 [Flavobacterium tructae]OXB21533.1 hypothetical protein B0A71_03235 [Flavobacterium tructae]
MRKKEILKVLFFSITIAATVKHIAIFAIGGYMETTKNSFHNDLINLDIYQEKATDIFYLELMNLIILPYVAAVLFYFFTRINLIQKNNFLLFIFLFTILFFLFYFFYKLFI